MAKAETLLWLADTAPLGADWFAAGLGWLNDAERLRHERFARAERRRQFVAGRILLRMALAELLGVAPCAVALTERPGNAPALAFPEQPGLGLSISHSGQWVACAVSLTGPVGLDIERIDPARDVLAIAEQAFGPEEAGQLKVLEATARADAFYRMWCRYEAHIKLGGKGVHDIFHAFPGLALVLSSMAALDVEPAMIDLRGVHSRAEATR
ncbi:4'-phosphopantetheinyl transferase superfamily protein [Massilia sp. IC2-278]|uniref:4'-phosphopantetheinyl transferase family protein n=1 Tax=Massilia sp. IC2-278 TaxID=2887200 RepID=UPI001E42DC46|nr:4'-phosphopantetheinyl transferase superfamily protein [Massilia sp. IC2-278]MCC2960374.1 4'-phosphopantetheinyl transferase superfamily protein [Massilia sp. IC2-278]